MRAAGPRPPGLRWASPALFGVVLISLALPFVSVSCRSGDTEVDLVTVRGFHLVTGGGPEINPAVARATEEEELAESADIGPQPFGIVAALAAIAGLGLGFARARRAAFVAAGSGLVGVISVVVAALRLDAHLTSALAGREAGQVVAQREIGYWVAVVAFALAAITGALSYLSQRPRRRRAG